MLYLPVRHRACSRALFAALTVCAFCFAVPARAQAPADTVYQAPAIVIESQRTDPRIDLFGRTGFVASVNAGERKARVEDLPHLLSQLVGLRTTQYGGLGSFATVSIRGSSSNQVTVFVDGIPVGDPYVGVTNIGDLPLGSVRRVDVYRGFSPVALGPSAIGGAINLITEDADAWRGAGPVPRVEVHSSMASFDTQRQIGSVWLQRAPFRLFLSGDLTQTGGDFRFLDDNGTPLQPNDDAIVTRVNNRTESHSGLAKLDVTSKTAGKLTVAQDVFDRDIGVPGIGSFQSTTAHASRRRRLTHANYESPTIASQLHFGTTAFYSRFNETFVDPGTDIALVAQDTDNTIRVYGGRARARWFLPLVPVSLEGVVDGRKEHFHPIDRVPALKEGPDQWRRTTTLGATAELYLFGDALTLSASSRRQEAISEFYDPPRFPWLPPVAQGRRTTTATSPSAGFRWQLHRTVAIKGNIGRYHRFPSFIEMFGNIGSVTGNPALSPEVSHNRDIGVVFSIDDIAMLRRSLLEVTWIDNDIDSLILYFPNSQFTSKPTNISSAQIRGWEIGASLLFDGDYQLDANYTFNDTKDTSEIPYYRGNQLPSRPRHIFNAAFSVPLPHTRVRYEYSHIGANYLDRANLQDVAHRDLHGLVLRIAPQRLRLSLTLEGRNLTDNQIADVSGFPLPGRSFYATLSFHYSTRKDDNS